MVFWPVAQLLQELIKSEAERKPCQGYSVMQLRGTLSLFTN